MAVGWGRGGTGGKSKWKQEPVNSPRGGPGGEPVWPRANLGSPYGLRFLRVEGLRPENLAGAALGRSPGRGRERC